MAVNPRGLVWRSCWGIEASSARGLLRGFAGPASQSSADIPLRVSGRLFLSDGLICGEFWWEMAECAWNYFRDKGGLE